MGSYRQYCPIARASEILAERWNPLIVRNLMFGANTFSELARGVPAMSRSMLLKRLGELERAGVLWKARKPDGHGHLYHLTDAGEDLADVIRTLGEWGETWRSPPSTPIQDLRFGRGARSNSTGPPYPRIGR
ncbi:hypothetical protein BH23ACT5_BH23ACT5_15190 [soil metagenome]